MDSAPKGVTSSEITASIAAVDGVTSVHDVHIWEVSPGESAVSAHIVHASGEDADAVLGGVRAALKKQFALEHSTIQVESQEYSKQYPCGNCSLE